MITKAQRVMLFGFWNRAKNVLMAGRETWTKDEENQRRHELTMKALGRDKSWNDLTNQDVDLVKGAMLAIIQPDNLSAQLRQLGQERNRALYRIRELRDDLDVDDAYVAAVIFRMSHEGKLSSSKIDNLKTAELRKVIGALKRTFNARQRDIAGAESRTQREYVLRMA